MYQCRILYANTLMQKFICQYPADIRFHENVLIEATGLLGARIGECDIRPYMSS